MIAWGAGYSSCWPALAVVVAVVVAEVGIAELLVGQSHLGIPVVDHTRTQLLHLVGNHRIHHPHPWGILLEKSIRLAVAAGSNHHHHLVDWHTG